MRIQASRTSLAFALALATLIGLPGLAVAKSKSFKGTFGPIKFNAANLKQSIVASLQFGNAGFIVTGSMRQGRVNLVQVTVTCATPGGPAVGSTYACAGTILQGGLSGTPRGWTTDDQLQVTITKFNGKRIAGTFAGTLENVGETNPPGDGPISVTGGKFAAKIAGAS